MTRQWRRKAWWTLGLTAAGLVALLLAGWLTFQHVPSWYRPTPVADAQAIRDDFVATFDGFSSALAKADGPFECALTQDQINAWLMARQEIWPLSRNWLPSELSDPFVVLERGAVRVAATYRSGGLQAVISGRLAVSGLRSGVLIRLLAVSGGSLPVPAGWIRGELAKLDAGPWPAGRGSSLQAIEEPLPPLSTLPEGALFPNTWIWQNGKIPFAITAVRVEPGSLVIQVEPLAHHPAGRR